MYQLEFVDSWETDQRFQWSKLFSFAVQRIEVDKNIIWIFWRELKDMHDCDCLSSSIQWSRDTQYFEIWLKGQKHQELAQSEPWDRSHSFETKDWSSANDVQISNENFSNVKRCLSRIENCSKIRIKDWRPWKHRTTPTANDQRHGWNAFGQNRRSASQFRSITPIQTVLLSWLEARHRRGQGDVLFPSPFEVLRELGRPSR